MDNRWMQGVLGTTDLHEAAIIIWNTSPETPVTRLQDRIYHAALGRRGHGIGLTEDEAVVQAAWDAYFTPFMRDLFDLQLWRERQIKDLNDDLKFDRITQVVYDSSVVVIDAQYTSRREDLAQQYATQADYLTPDDETGEG